MARIEITIDGTAYPCRQTMGATLLFKRETGKEISEIGGSLSDMCVYLWCCVKSSCRHDGVEFCMALEDFADALPLEAVTAWFNAVAAEAPQEKTPAGKN